MAYTISAPIFAAAYAKIKLPSDFTIANCPFENIPEAQYILFAELDCARQDEENSVLIPIPILLGSIRPVQDNRWLYTPDEQPLFADEEPESEGDQDEEQPPLSLIE